ncbi:MAG TPA: hypothetical protein VFE04_01825, partial [Puia sp.]|nr:hypothetical protein [Puia sp.]
METPETLPAYSGPFKSDYLEKKSDLLLICIPGLFLLILTLPFITGEYWSDEIYSVMVSRSWSVMQEYFRNYENNMSLYYISLHL